MKNVTEKSRYRKTHASNTNLNATEARERQCSDSVFHLMMAKACLKKKQKRSLLQIVCHTTVIAEIFVRVKISYSSVCQLSYARNFRTATVVSDILVYVYGFRMLLNFVLPAKSTKYTKLNRVRNFVRLEYSKLTGGCSLLGRLVGRNCRPPRLVGHRYLGREGQWQSKLGLILMWTPVKPKKEEEKERKKNHRWGE